MKPHSDYKQFEGSEFGRGNAFAIWNDCVLAVECPNRAPSLFLKMRDMEEGSQKRMQILRGHHRHFIDDEETVVCRVIESDTCIIGIFPKNATDALFCDVNLAQWREIHNWRICKSSSVRNSCNITGTFTIAGWKTPEEQYELMAQSANNNLVFVLRNKDPTSGAKFKMITCWQNKTGFSHSVMNPQPNSTCLSADCCNRTNSVLTLEATDDGRTHMKSYTRVLGPRYSNVEVCAVNGVCCASQLMDMHVTVYGTPSARIRSCRPRFRQQIKVSGQPQQYGRPSPLPGRIAWG